MIRHSNVCEVDEDKEKKDKNAIKNHLILSRRNNATNRKCMKNTPSSLLNCWTTRCLLAVLFTREMM